MIATAPTYTPDEIAATLLEVAETKHHFPPVSRFHLAVIVILARYAHSHPGAYLTPAAIATAVRNLPEFGRAYAATGISLTLYQLPGILSYHISPRLILRRVALKRKVASQPGHPSYGYRLVDLDTEP